MPILLHRLVVDAKALKTNIDKKTFKNLTEMTLVMVILLNRRRVGEAQYMLRKEYEKGTNCDPDSDVFQT